MSDVQRFFQRPVVEAMHWTGDNFDEIADWVREKSRHPVGSISHSGGVLTMWAGTQPWAIGPTGWVVYSQQWGWSTWAEHAFAQSHEPECAPPDDDDLEQS